MSELGGFCLSNICFPTWHLPSSDDRLDDKDSVDIHDNPPLPDNVVKEEDNTVRHPKPTTYHVARTSRDLFAMRANCPENW